MKSVGRKWCIYSREAVIIHRRLVSSPDQYNAMFIARPDRSDCPLSLTGRDPPTKGGVDCHANACASNEQLYKHCVIRDHTALTDFRVHVLGKITDSACSIGNANILLSIHTCT